MSFNRSFLASLATFLLPVLASYSFAASRTADWPAWRGPSRNGLADPAQNPPLMWSETQNVLWKVPIPGRGHGSPTIVGDRVYLATADPQTRTQSVLCYDRQRGTQVWLTQVHGANADPGRHANSSAASSTVTWDGERLFINFLNGGAVFTTALDSNGCVLWQQRICDYVVHQGFGSSPVVHGPLVLVSADHRGGGTIAALERATGKVVWRHDDRPRIANYTTPAIVQAAGRTQMVLAGCNLIASFDPLTGSKLWQVDGSTEECVVTAVTDGDRVFVSGGYPRNHTVAIVADGSGKVAWQNTTRVYVPSMIVKDGHLYAVTDAGMAVCWKSDTGEELWKERLGGDFYASPVMVGDRVYASNLGANTFVFEARPSGFKLLAQNQLGDEAYASPAICGGRIYLRLAVKEESRQEYLYCIGTGK